ncbi:MAG: hypothetical protein CME31_28595 [Gimesia sp.]|uniref:Uncharacterized protein n=1 Tax=Gimesia maris TaxID=122 RepID=A0A3D3RAA4_9PLAN|nr:hypothetical protein [Gimesia sp.]HCO24937.1 hypothetical protein [Gimesia maris]
MFPESAVCILDGKIRSSRNLGPESVAGTFRKYSLQRPKFLGAPTDLGQDEMITPYVFSAKLLHLRGLK